MSKENPEMIVELEARLDGIEEYDAERQSSNPAYSDVPQLVKALKYSLEQMRGRIHAPIITEIERGVLSILTVKGLS